MKRLLPFAIALLLSAALSASIPPAGLGLGFSGYPAGMTPSVPTNLILTQGNGGSSSNQVNLAWTASTGSPTGYNVYRNGSLYASNQACCTYSDTSATGVNAPRGVNTGGAFIDDVTFTYTLTAVNGSGESAHAYPVSYLFNGVAGGPQNSCSNYSFGGSSTTTGSISSGSLQIVNITAGNVYPYQPVSDGAANNVIGGAWSTGNPPNYFLPYGSGGTTGTGTGAGSYELARAASGATASETIIVGRENVSPYQGNNPENCWDTQNPEPGATYDLSLVNGAMQQYTTGISPGYDYNAGGMGYFTVDINIPVANVSNTAQPFFIYSRPGPGSIYSGDVFPNYSSTLWTCNGTTCSSNYVAAGGTSIPLNTWTQLKIPLSTLSIGTGTFTGCMNVTWQGTAQLTNGGHGELVNLNAPTGGSGYTNGTYTNVALSYSTGSGGSGATANVTVSGGAVTAVAINSPGTNYADNDSLTVSNTLIGGTGSGFVVTVQHIGFRYVWQSTGVGTAPTTGSTVTAFNGGATGTLGQSLGSNTWETNVPDWFTFPTGTTVGFTIASLIVTAVNSGVGPDVTSFITGNSLPAGIFLSGNLPGYGPGTNSSIGAFQVADGPGNTIPASGLGTASGPNTCSSTVTFTSDRVSLYKPQFKLASAAFYTEVLLDRYGWSTN